MVQRHSRRRTLVAKRTTFTSWSRNNESGMTRRHIFRAVFLALLLLLLVQLVLIFRPFFTPIAWAVILASVTYPLHRMILHWTGHSAPVAATISTVLITVTAVVPAMSILFLGIQETAELME